MIACLAPNGMTVYRGDAPCQRLLVGTINGVAVLERVGAGAWRQTGTVLDGLHISSMLIEPKRGGLFAGVHRGGVHFSGDGGKSWEERANGITTRHVYTLGAVEEKGEPVLYAGTEPVNLFRSRDYGKSWQELPAVGQVPGNDTWVFPMPPKVAHPNCDPNDPLCGADIKEEGIGYTQRRVQVDFPRSQWGIGGQLPGEVFRAREIIPP